MRNFPDGTTYVTNIVERFGYCAVQWATEWDPSLADLLRVAPELVLGKRVVITSCDSGAYKPSLAEVNTGWSLAGAVAISKEITRVEELPAPGFDEWYVFDVAPIVAPTHNYVNQYNFSVTGESDTTASFWEQINRTQPLHVLGAGTPHMFFATRDRDGFNRVKKFRLIAQPAEE